MEKTPLFDFLSNERGQAALVDSMFFIAIVSAVCTAMFYFAINYGLTTESLLDSFYSQDFATDSLKVITYINVFRDGNAVSADMDLSHSTPQFDYMLALIKEDYVKNKSLTIQTKTAIANTLHSALKPFDSSVDYVYYIAKEGFTSGDQKYIAMIISTRKCTAGCDFNSNAADRKISRVYYSCAPPESNALEKYLFPYAGKVDFAEGKITLIDVVTTDSQNETYSPYITRLYLWVAKKIPALDNIVQHATTSAVNPDNEANFNCVLLNTN